MSAVDTTRADDQELASHRPVLLSSVCIVHICLCKVGSCEWCAAGDKAGGCVRALYDPTLSERGVLLCAARKPRAKDPLDFEVSMCFD